MKRVKNLAGCFILFILFFTQVPANSQSLIVETQYGPVQGFKTGDIFAFLGIPFAKPPIDELRWQPPREPDSWIDTLAALDFGPPCPQKRYEQGDSLAEIIGEEDCLTLNVWTPAADDEKRPVLAFIHGGGNQQGSTSQFTGGARIYDGAQIAQRSNSVVVTFEYRLGPLGFLVHPGLSEESAHGVSGNYGLLDQILALKWIQKNISAFGGDSARVMIFGESGGAVDVSLLLTSPLATGLFSRALVQSGAPVAKSLAEREAEGIAFAEKLKCNSGSREEQVAALRALPPDSLIKSLEDPLAGGLVQMAWGASVDGWVLPEEPLAAFESGDFNHVPVTIGSNADETAIMAPPVVTPDEFELFFKLTLPAELYAEFLAHYPPGSSNRTAREAYIQATTDAQFTSQARRLARAIEQHQAEPVWRYFFEHSLNGLSSLYGAYHGLELFFVFQSIENSTYARNGNLTASDQSVAGKMLGYWSRFAASGNPNGGDAPAWPEYAANSDPYIKLNAFPSAGLGLRTDKCDFWDKVNAAITSVAEPGPASPAFFQLDQNYPNPFNPSTRISFQLAGTSHVTLKIFDARGREVATLADGAMTPGNHAVTFSPRDFASGIYFYRLTAGQFSQTRKAIFIK